jgi:lysophospholipase L1-like esterase
MEKINISHLKQVLFSVILLVLFLILGEVILRVIYFNRFSTEYFAIDRFFHSLEFRYLTYKGKLSMEDVYKKAWENSYIERGYPVPKEGPREGYWGDRLGRQTENQFLGWQTPKISIKNLVEVDQHGMQHAGRKDAPCHILIIGASVAGGASASEISTTYFVKLFQYLEDAKKAVKVTVYAGGGWISAQEVSALLYKGLQLHPDIVIFLDGLNDLVNQINVRQLHEYRKNIPYEERASDYLENMKVAKNLCKCNGIKIVFVLQPFLVWEKNITVYEQDFLKQKYVGDVDMLSKYYELIKKELESLVENNVYFIDCSNVLSDEKATTFSDLWHFSDFGHDLLGKYIADKLIYILNHCCQARTSKERVD